MLSTSISSDDLLNIEAPQPNVLSSKGHSYDPASRKSLNDFLKKRMIKENILNFNGNLYYLDQENRTIIVVPHGNFRNVSCIEVRGNDHVDLQTCARIYFTAIPIVNSNVARLQAGKYEEEIPRFEGFEVDTETGTITGLSDQLNQKVNYTVDKSFKKSLDKILQAPKDMKDTQAFKPREIDINDEKPQQFHSWDAYDPAVYKPASTFEFWSNGTYKEENIPQNGYWTLSSHWTSACNGAYELAKDKKVTLSKTVADIYTKIETKFKQDKKMPGNLLNVATRRTELKEQKEDNLVLLEFWRKELRTRLGLETSNKKYDNPEMLRGIPLKYQKIADMVNYHKTLDQFFDKNMPPESSTLFTHDEDDLFGSQSSIPKVKSRSSSVDSTNPLNPFSGTRMIDGLEHEFPSGYEPPPPEEEDDDD